MTNCAHFGKLFEGGHKRSLTSVALVLVTVFVALSGNLHAQQMPNPEGAKAIEGSWIFSVRALNGSYYFTAVASFTAGDVFLATGSNDRIIPVSPLYGTWAYKGRNRFNATADFIGFDMAGNPIAMLHIVQGFELKHDGELVGVGEFSVCDVEGENCQRTPESDFSVTARRIVPADLTERTLP